jgi:hypothetical protein
MILFAAAAFVLLTVPLAGGRLRALNDLHLCSWWMLALAIGIQAVIIEALAATIPAWAANLLHVISFVLALGFVWRNRRVAGIWIIGLGGLANGVAIAANGGTMPASRGALQQAGITFRPAHGFRNSVYVPHAKLQFLGDVFAIPKGWPLANVFSIGDLLVVVGAFVLVHTVCESKLAIRRRPPAEPVAANDAAELRGAAS